MTQGEIRAEVLRHIKSNVTSNILHDQPLYDLAVRVQADCPRVQGYGAVEVYAALWSLVREGIIVPGQRTTGRFEFANSAQSGFPYFSLTAYGRDVLTSDNDFEPADVARYMEALRARVPSSSNLVLRYVAEAAATFNSQHYLASTVLLGVAAESVLDDTYAVIAQHIEPHGGTFKQKLVAKRWATPRFEYAMERLKPHLAEAPKELADRFNAQFEYLVQILKFSRDDVGHARPERVDQDVARLNLVC